MSKKELYEARTKAFRYLAILVAILFHAAIVTNDPMGKIIMGLLLVVCVFCEMYVYDRLMRAIKRRR